MFGLSIIHQLAMSTLKFRSKSNVLHFKAQSKNNSHVS